MCLEPFCRVHNLDTLQLKVKTQAMLLQETGVCMVVQTKADNLVLGTFRFGSVLAKLTEPFGAPLEKICLNDMGDFGA